MRMSLRVSLLLVALMLGAPARAAVTFTNGTSITVPVSGTEGPGSPYPSAIGFAVFSGVVVDVNVTLHEVSHGYPDDLDILLVGPLGQELVIQADAGGDASESISGLTYTIDDDAAEALPDNVRIAPDTGRFRPADYDISLADDFSTGLGPPAPYLHAAPTGVETLDGTFGGGSPNGVWNLFVLDDTSADIGTIAGGWSIEIEVAAFAPDFANEEPIVVSEVGPATPYPSTIHVTGMGAIETVQVNLHGVTHTYPDDLAVLLEAPSGDRMILQSGAGGNADAESVSYGFDDFAAALADGGELPTGGAAVRPTSYDDPDFAVGGGPAAPYLQPFPGGVASLATTFAGQAANGTWKLYVVDCCAPDAGVIENGWSLAITAPEPGTAAASLVAAASLAAASRRRVTPRAGASRRGSCPSCATRSSRSRG